jgi:DNA-binding IclR family transcriptional regulator
MPDGDQYVIEILDVALDVIEGLKAGNGAPQGASQLSRELGINRTRVFRVLKTLERRGYVQVDAETQRYSLALKFLELGESVRRQVDILRLAQPILRELAQQSGDSAVLVLLYGDKAVCVDRYQGQHMLQAEDPIGELLPLHIGASPKMLLAYMPEGERERIIQGMELTRFTPITVTDRDELWKRLQQIRSQGHAVSYGDLEIGICAVAAPVRDHSGGVVAGVTVTVPEIRFTPQHHEELVGLVGSAADRISEQLGWSSEHA